MKVEVDIKTFLKAINEFLIDEQQPCGVQVVEWVGLESALAPQDHGIFRID